MIETTTRSRKDPLKPIKMEDIKIEFVDLCVLPSDGMNIVEIDSDAESSTSAAMEITIPTSSPSEAVRPRKRAKLDHLSAEEKAQHRKMMNRISAQSARDRQKALMLQQESSIKTLQATTDALRKQNTVLTAKNNTLSTENKSLKQENQRLSALVMQLEAKLKATASQVQNSTVYSTVEEQSVVPTEQVIKLEVQDENNNCGGSSMEPAVLRAVPLQKGPSEPLQKLSLILLLWTMCLGISTHQNSSKSSETFLKKFLEQNKNCQNLNSLAQLQKILLHKWLLRPRPQEVEQKTPG